MQIDAKKDKIKCKKRKKYKNKKLSGASYYIKNAKTQREQNIQNLQNMQKEKKNRNCTCTPAISTLYLLT